jgi:NAD(P)H-flavin reductase
MEEYLGEITAARPLTLSVLELTVHLVAPSTVAFTPGQHMIYKAEGRDHILPIAFPPRENNTDIVLLLSTSAESSLGAETERLKIGNKMALEGPAGEFVIKDPQRDILAIAGGVGIAPFAAIVPPLLISGFTGKFKLVFQVRSEEDVFYFERFNGLAARHPNFSFVPMVVRPHAHWPGEVGTAATYIQVSAEFLGSYAPYICGEEKFIEETLANWKKYVPKGDKPVTCTLS